VVRTPKPGDIVLYSFGHTGVVEAVRHRDCPWIQGVMWHPERYHPFRERDITWIKEALAL
jgi:gamma-glutamyl-gamma-aminobutyrate hydrolase PuuD